MSLLEEAKMVEVTKRYLKAPSEELLELACAYLRHTETTCKIYLHENHHNQPHG